MGKLSRRGFIKQAAVCACGAAASGLLPDFAVSSAHAAPGNGTKVLFINMNGGWDGLAILQPRSGTLYSTLAPLRPTLALDPSTLLAADADFGFHPLLTTFKSIYDEGRLATVLNVGYQNMSRSHAESEIVYARGIANRFSAGTTGFLNRMGERFSWSPTQAVSVSGSDRAFNGSTYRGTQVNSLSSFRFESDGTQNTHESTYRRDTLYSISQDGVLDSAKPSQQQEKENIGLVVNTVDAVREAITTVVYPTPYPNTGTARRFSDVEVLFSNSSLNSEVAYIRIGGFDTHSTQAASLAGTLPNFNAALGVFINNMKARGLWNNLIIAIYSEFGRTNRENGSGGTDHGGAIPFMLLGGAVNGGMYGSILPTHLTGGGWLPMNYNLVEIYRRILMRMDYDPDQIFETPGGPQLTGLFT